MKIVRIAGIACLVLSYAFGGFAPAAGQQPKPKIAAIVPPVDFSVIRVGLKGIEPLPEPTALAREKLEHSLQLAFARVGAFDVVAPPALSPEETTIFNEQLALIRMSVTARAANVLNLRPFDPKNDPPDYSVGPALAFLAERTGAQRLVYVFGKKFVSGGGRAALAAALSPIAMVPTKNTELGVAVVELRSGRITWMNFVQDINADVTDRRGANAYLLPAFGDYPKTALGELGSGRDDPPAKLHEDRGDEFSVMLPAGWHKVPGWTANEVMLSRHNVLVDVITIDRLKPDQAFKSQGKVAGPALDPVETGRLTINEMKATAAYQALELDDIRPATVGGLPGFRADSHIVFAYDGTNGMRLRQRLYGVATDAGLYLLKLESVGPVYFDENLPAFDAMVQTLKLGPIKVRPVGASR